MEKQGVRHPAHVPAERRENERLQLALLSYYYAAPSVHFYISYFIRGIEYGPKKPYFSTNFTRYIPKW